MNTSDSKTPATSFEIRERKILLLLCLLAAVHVFIFSAAFPFFVSTDEQLHFDLVVKYARGEIPRSLNPPCAEALPYIVIFHSKEYLWSPTNADEKIPPPPWTQPTDATRQYLLQKEMLWKNVINQEASQPPLYYSLASLWWRLGKILGLDGGRVLYWIRFLNIFIVVTIVWLGYRAAQIVFPENLFLRIGVPAIVAFMPQTAFYSIENDVLSPLCFGAAFILLLKFSRADPPDCKLGAAAGLGLAATYLTKISNLPLLAASGIFIALKIWRLFKDGKLRPAISSILSLAIFAALPAAFWIAWTKSNFGDFTGSAAKIKFLGWTNQPLAEWFHHPIFTPRGLWIFLSGNLDTFWQGEMSWHRAPLSLPVVNLIYTLVSLGLLTWTLAVLSRQSAIGASPQNKILWFAFGCVAACFAFFALLSIKYDFQDCFYPSRAHPYFTSGRLMLGALIPFLLLFVYGLDCLLKKFGNAARFVVLGIIISFMLAGEIVTDWPVFFSAYNWFHL